MKRFLFLLAVLVLLSVPLSGALAQGGSDAVIFRSIGNVSTFNPLFTTDEGSNNAVYAMWPLPFDVDRFTGIPQPGLTSWTISEDGLTYSFKIRDDAVWSDGTPITSKDAKFTYDAAASKVVGSNRAANTASIKEVKIIDDKNYQVILNKANCAVMQDFFSINWLPAHRFKADFSDIQTNILNTKPDISGGPYILDDIKTDEYFAFHANPTYWGGKPKIDKLIYKVITDPAISAQALASGDVDYDHLNPDEFEQVPVKDNLNYKAVAQDSIGLFFMNWADPNNPQPAYDKDGKPLQQTPHPIFADKTVRRAVAMGYDKNAILQTLGDNGGSLLVGSVVPAMTWAFNSDIQPYSYDPKQAAALLDQAGWKLNPATGIREKDGKLMEFEIVYSPVAKYFDTTALVAQDQLGQLGMKVKVTSLEWGAYLNDRLLAQKFDVSVVGWGGSPPPDPTSTEPLLLSTGDVPGSGFDVSSYVSPELDKVMREGRTVPGCDLQKRGDLYKQMQKIQHDDVAIDFTISPYTVHAMNKRVQGFNPGPWWYQQLTPQELYFGS
jgi:peptide/nickel transport system substrate-binding protein